MAKRHERDPAAMEALNLDQMVGSMGYLMDWRHEQPPEYIAEMEPDKLILALRINLAEAGNKVSDLAHKHGEGPYSHPGLEFLSEALKKISRGEPVEANPFSVKREV